MNIRSMLLAGNATVTALSKVTGARFTFKVKSPKDATPDSPHFVSVLTGCDNEGDYSFLGTIFTSGDYRHGKKSRITTDAASAKAFDWLWRNIDALPADKVELLPSSSCMRCGRKLTVPQSIENALGPECAAKLGV